MPELKPISGHTGCARIQKYLEKNGRAIAKDFFNLEAWDERSMKGYDDELKANIEWAREMDEFRSAWGNDRPVGGARARTFKHFVLSPDPEDNISLDQLRELTCAWAMKFWSEYQVAIIYHDDNAGHIPHAHIVVNNTNINTHRRMRTTNPLQLNRDLQKMAVERGLRGMSNIIEAKGTVGRIAQKDVPDIMTKKTPRTRRSVYIGRKEKEIVEAGGYSWVADIRSRVSIARSLAKDQSDFERLIDAMGLSMTENSAGARRRDWVFSLTDDPSKKVTGERLGYMFGKEALERRFSRMGAYRPSERTTKAIAMRAETAIELNDLGELYEMSNALEICAKYNIRSIADFDTPIERAKNPEQAAALNDARKFMTENKLLPKSVIRKTKGDIQRATLPQTTTNDDTKFYQQQAAAMQRQQQRGRTR